MKLFLVCAYYKDDAMQYCIITIFKNMMDEIPSPYMYAFLEALSIQVVQQQPKKKRFLKKKDFLFYFELFFLFCLADFSVTLVICYLRNVS